MRVSTQQFFSQNLGNVQKGNAELLKLQQQLSSGKKISKPSDDPLAASQIQKLESQITRADSFLRNVDMAENRLNSVETTLDAVIDSVLRLKDLGVQVNNGTLNDNDRKIVGAEFEQTLSQLTGLLNTRDSEGESLFSGFRGQLQSYSTNAMDQFEFKGDGGQRSLDIGENARVQITDSGAHIFGSGTDNLLNTVKHMAESLNATPADMVAFDSRRSELDQFFEQAVVSRSQIGARLNVLQDQREQLADMKFNTQTTLSKIQDTDYYEATSNLLLQQNALEASYATFGKIQGLSLFNFIGR